MNIGLIITGGIIATAAFALPNIANKMMFVPNKNVPAQYNEHELFVKNISCMFFDKGNNTPIVIYSHGNAGNIFDRQGLHRLLPDASFFMYDYRGFGRSSNKTTSTESIIKDGENVYSHIITNYPDRKIILLGESMGSAVTWHLASKYEVDGVAILSGYSSLSKVINNIIPCGGSLLSCRMKLPNNLLLCQKVYCPILMIHGKNDNLIPCDHAEELKNANSYINLP